MPSRVLAWKCDYCNKVTVSAGSTAAHEAFCKKNPKNRYCATCSKCYSKTVADNSDGEFPFKQEIVWCKQFDKPIHEKPYYDDCQMQEEDYGSESYPIPCTCRKYEQKTEQDGGAE